MCHLFARSSPAVERSLPTLGTLAFQPLESWCSTSEIRVLAPINNATQERCARGLEIVAETDSEGHEVGVAWDEGGRYIELRAERELVFQLAPVPEELTLPLVRGAALKVLRVDVPW